MPIAELIGRAFIGFAVVFMASYLFIHAVVFLTRFWRRRKAGLTRHHAWGLEDVLNRLQREHDRYHSTGYCYGDSHSGYTMQIEALKRAIAFCKLQE